MLHDDCNPEENDTETEAGRNIDSYLTDSSLDLILEEIFNERLMRSSRTSKAPKHLMILFNDIFSSMSPN